MLKYFFDMILCNLMLVTGRILSYFKREREQLCPDTVLLELYIVIRISNFFLLEMLQYLSCPNKSAAA
jgi:hypothetical protein